MNARDAYKDYEFKDFETEKQNTIIIARELLYSDKVIKKLEKAKTSIQLSNIMTQARRDEV